MSSLFEDASLITTPNAYKAGKLYSIKPTNGDGDLDVVRATTATRVNENGLIESVDVNVPRIDYTNGNCPSILVEGQRTNFIRNSETPSNWAYTEFGSGSTGVITTGKTDKFGGTNAAQIDFPSDAENVKIEFDSINNFASQNTCSIYIKLVGNIPDKIIRFRAGNFKFVTISGNEFIRYDVTIDKSTGESFTLKLRPSQGTSSGGFSIIICHPQEEQGTEPSSYIPTIKLLNPKVICYLCHSFCFRSFRKS